jgi:hypothetical protein
MFLSRPPHGRAFGATVAGGGRPLAPAIVFATSIDGVWADHGATWPNARTYSPPAGMRSSATLQAPLSATPYRPSPVSVGPLPVDGDLLNGLPGPEVGPMAGGGGPGGSGPPPNPPDDGPFPIVPSGGGPGGGGPGGGGPGPSPPPIVPPGGGPGGGPPPVAGVPEPSDWTMMVFGLLALGVPLRLPSRNRRARPSCAQSYSPLAAMPAYSDVGAVRPTCRMPRCIPARSSPCRPRTGPCSM